MDLKRLRTFVAIADCGTASRAALQLRTAQPGLSRHLIDLEEEFGLKLFDRAGRGLVLTRAGEQLLGHCRDILVRVAFLSEQARLLRDGDAGLLKVAASPQIIEGVLSGLLPRYERSHPDVQVKLTEAVGRDQLTLLERGDVDVSLGLLSAIQTEDRFASFELPAVEILAACHPKLSFGKLGPVDIATLSEHPLLLLDSTYAFRKSFDAACRLAGVEPKILMESRAPHTLLALAESGSGIAIIQTAVPVNRYRLRVVRITYRRKPIRVPMAAIWDKRRKLPRYAEAFFGMLAEDMQREFPISGPRRTMRRT
jgi:DNA-binding transcriptional LysR family regulator